MKNFLWIFFLLFEGILTAPPSYSVWPSQFHASIVLADSTFWPFPEESLGLTSSGTYYYDYTNQRAAFIINQAASNKIIHEIIIGKTVYQIDGPTGKCTQTSTNASPRYEILNPNFLSSNKFTYVADDYLIQNNIYFFTHHWKHEPLLSTDINYWHNVPNDSPYRLEWGSESLNPVIMEFTQVIAGFDDVPDLNSIFKLPSTCQKDNLLFKEEEYQPKPRPQKPTATKGTQWPFQWNAKCDYTGNNFGFFQDSLNASYMETVSVQLSGHYYYDWINKRECNFWIDLTTGTKTKTLIVNGTFYQVTLATNQCQIVPISEYVNGPLKPDWPTHLPYLDQQFLFRPPSFQRTKHFQFDAFNAGPDNSFNYWESEEGLPLEFEGPILDFWPYGVNMMEWREHEYGLEGIDVENIYSVPKNCSIIPMSALKETKIHPMISLHLFFSKLRKN